MINLNFSEFIENRIANIKAADSFAFASAIGLGPWLVPLGPAIVFGYALHRSAPADMGEFRLVAAVSVGIGLVVAGAVSSHNAIVSGAAKAWSLVIGYIGLEIIGLWLMSVTADVKVVGTVASLLTLIVYLARSSAKEVDSGRAEAKKAEQFKLSYQVEQARLEAEHRRAMEAEKARLGHERKMAKLQVESVKESVKPSVKPSVKGFTLEDIKNAPRTPKGGINVTKLAELTGVSRPTVYTKLNSMVDSGQLIKNGNGYEVIE